MDKQLTEKKEIGSNVTSLAIRQRMENLETNIIRSKIIIGVFRAEIRHLRENTPMPKYTFSFSFCNPENKEGRIKELEASIYWACLRLKEMKEELEELKKTLG